MFDRKSLEADGFEGFVKISDLKKQVGCNLLPHQRGVYVIYREDSKYPTFLEINPGGHFHDEDPTVSLDVLRQNWVVGANVMYFGKAGGDDCSATISSRIKQYMAFGRGKRVGHRGGKLIWQLSDSDDLLVAWKTLDEDDPRVIERVLIRKFAEIYGNMPFANLK